MNVVPHLQRLLMKVLGIVLPDAELVQGEREGLVGEATRVAIQRFLAERRLTIPEGMEQQSLQWFEWLIQQLEAGRTEFVIFGQIRDTTERPLSGARLQAFDRDLPSVERRQDY